MKKEENFYTVDAAGKTIGRVSTEVATILMGKNKANYQRHTVPVNKVKLINTSKAKVPFKKLSGKIYKSHSQHPGGYKEVSLSKLIEKKGHGESFKKAIYGMLPKNKLRAIMLKNLTITE